MCEFKVLNVKDNTQLGEDVVVLNYSKGNSLILKDILGSGNKLDSALIYDVNTLNQTCLVVEHPLIKPFLALIEKLSEDNASTKDFEDFEVILQNHKKQL